MKDAAQLILQLPVGAEQAALLQKYGIAESDCTNLMLLIVKTVQMAADLIADKEAAHTLADEWVASIPDWEE